MPLFAKQVPARLVTELSCFFGIGTIALTYILAIYVEKLAPPFPFMPMISDTFVPAPGSYISRFGMTITALLLWANQQLFMFYSLATPIGGNPSWPIRDKLAYLTGTIASF